MMKDKYKILIISSWIVLIICFAIKLFGGNWFEVMVENQNFINACNWLENNIIVRNAVYLILFIFTNIFYQLGVIKQKWYKPKQYLIFIPMIILWLLKTIITNQVILFLIDMIIFIALPILLNYKCWLRSIIGVGLILVFQIICLLTKNIGITIIGEEVLTSIILMLDYYIMIILYYLYSNRKEEI